MARESRVLFNWALSSYFGWGVYGVNLLLAWAGRTDLLPATLIPFRPEQVDLDALDQARIAPALQRSREVQDGLKHLQAQAARASCLVLHTLRNGMEQDTVAHGVFLQGSPSVGVAFWEHANLAVEARARLRDYPLVIAGSTWNQKLLRASGAQRVELVVQGVDTSLFHPAPKRGSFADRFVVFSGGKLEYRKGQDLVLRAFRIFAAQHKDALLLTAWASPWPHLARELGVSEGLTPPPFSAHGKFDALAWTRTNGVPDAQVFHCGAVANHCMPRILREADVAIFASRAEGGTNLVAMECIACGVPVILSANTGHLDLLHDGTATALRRQGPVAGENTAEWGNSDIEEMVAALESVYLDREASRRRGLEGAAGISQLTWATQMDKLAELLLPLRP